MDTWVHHHPHYTLMPSVHLRCCHILPSGLHWQWIFFPWSRTRSSVNHLWGKWGVSAKIRRRLTGHIWKESWSYSWSSELCSGPQRLKYQSHKRMDRWLLPWESGSHASPKHLNHGKVAFQLHLYLVSKTLPPWGQQQENGSFHPPKDLLPGGKARMWAEGWNLLWFLLAPGPDKSEPWFSSSLLEGGIN